MATYDPAGHPLLSDTAQALESADAAAFGAQADAAEAVLNLPAGLIGADAARATLAVALRVNCQLARAEAGVITSESKGDQSVSYAVGRASADADPCAMAARIAADLTAAAVAASGYFPPLVSVR